MRVSVIFLLTAFLNCLSAGAADELFSDVKARSVFAADKSTEAAEDAAPVPSQGRWVLSATSLAELLKGEGYTTRLVDDNSVATEVRLDAQQYPVIISIFAKEDRLRLSLQLRELADAGTLSSDYWLTVMSRNSTAMNGQFAFNKSTECLELVHFLNNQRVTGASLVTKLQTLAQTANESVSDWNPRSPRSAVGGKPSLAESDKSGVPAVDPAVRTPLNLVGQWTAVGANQAQFAIQFGSDKKFVLAVVSGKQSSKSTGNFTLKDTQITLQATDGTTLTGTITDMRGPAEGKQAAATTTSSLSDSFQLKISNGPSLDFKRSTK
jgi:hypothetical protein